MATETEKRLSKEPNSPSPVNAIVSRRRLVFAWLALGLAVAAVGSFAATRSGLLDVDEIRLVGVSPELGHLAVLEILSIEVGVPMVGIDLDGAERRVGALPRVAEVEVGRDWPGSLVVWILERKAVVNAMAANGQVALLDAQGTVLDHITVADPNLPIVRVDDLGRPGSRMIGLDPLLSAANAVTDELAAWIIGLVPTANGVRAELVGGVEVELGLADDYQDQMRALATVLSRVELACIVLIDVSVYSIPVVRRDDVHCS
ncbi:MAG: FtsQ-type POTRA domain-containing protein [Acidimicrobiales bacterium]|nr:FtsQ-type POTRA domain-containing protein [Acidimicrobiales bacterium]